MISSREAFDRLRAGNRRFVSSVLDPAAILDAEQRARLAAGQEPFAIVLGCSDSRVPAELVFDQGFGGLFVIRVAGNIVAPSRSEASSSPPRASARALVVVLGHYAVRRHPGHARGAAAAHAGPVAQPALDRGPGASVRRARCSAPISRHDRTRWCTPRCAPTFARRRVTCGTGSEILERLIRGGRARRRGAEYSLETGVVEFFDGRSGRVGPAGVGPRRERRSHASRTGPGGARRAAIGRRGARGAPQG